jgi:NAD(P)H-hydrate epimerase
MERASLAFVDAFEDLYNGQKSSVTIFCGTGNNGGDGLAIARLLHQRGWSVDCAIVHFSETCSVDNQTNQDRLLRAGITVQHIRSRRDIPTVQNGVVIDALLGTGVTKPLTGLLEIIVSHLNASEVHICSVDLPSGLFVQGDCSNYISNMIHAEHTITFQTVKKNFLLADYGKVVGEWHVVDIGLNLTCIDEEACDSFLTEAHEIHSKLKLRSAFSHKGNYGHAALICGSKGMMGAAVLSTKACLRSGAGLSTIITAACGYEIMQTSCPEAMCITSGKDAISECPAIDKYTALGVGPGIGTDEATRNVVHTILKTSEQPLVLDADALNLLTESDLQYLPKSSVLTPHPKEFSRLFGATKSSSEQTELARLKSIEYQCILILKGRYSAVCLPNGTVHFNPTGNPGMAKGGSGDVLTGLLTGMLARGYSSEDAAIIGCFIHGRAGDLAAEKIGQEGMTSGDILSLIPKAHRSV